MLRTRSCIRCSNEFEGGSRAIYCPTCRFTRRQELRDEYLSTHDPAKIRKIGSSAHCERCTTEYTVSKTRQKYCEICSEIEKKEQIKRRSAAFKEANPNYRKEADRERIERSSKICVECGNTFKSITLKKYCSPECRKIGFYAKRKNKQ